jgi:hypothetical protein
LNLQLIPPKGITLPLCYTQKEKPGYLVRDCVNKLKEIEEEKEKKKKKKEKEPIENKERGKPGKARRRIRKFIRSSGLCGRKEETEKSNRAEKF